jgi:Flp pilus assembly protein TadB
MERHEPNPSPHDPVITVEAAPPDGRGAGGWTAPIDPESHPKAECHHQIQFLDLHAQGRLLVVASVVAVYASNLVLLLGVLFSLLLLVFGLLTADRFAISVGLLVVCGAALQSVGNIELMVTWSRLHRPRGAAMVLASIGYVTFLFGTVLFIVREESYGLLLVLLPAAIVMWTLWSYRRVLYDRRTCQTHPEFPASVLAMLREDSRPST